MKEVFDSKGRLLPGWRKFEGSSTDWFYVFEPGKNYRVYYKEIKTPEEERKFLEDMDREQGME